MNVPVNQIELVSSTINDTRTNLSNVIIEKQMHRFKGLLDESNKNLLRKEGIIRSLRDDIHDLEFKVKSLEAKVHDFEKGKMVVENGCQTHSGEIAILKVRILNLETENRALRSTSSSHSSTCDLEKMYVGQKPHDKTGLGYEKFPTSSFTKKTGCPTTKSKSPQTKYVNKSAKDKKNRGLAHLYRWLPRKRYGMNQNIGSQSTLRPQFLNNVYFKGPNGWYYENKNKKILKQIWVPKIEPRRGDLQHKNKNKQIFVQKQQVCLASKDVPKNKVVDVKAQFQNRFIKGETLENKPTRAFCNYCCKLGHISLDCRIRNLSIKGEISWVPKATSTGTGTPKIH